MRSSVTDSEAGSEYSSRVSCWISRIIAVPSLRRVVLLDRAADVGGASEHVRQESVQARPAPERLDLGVLEVGREPPEHAVRATRPRGTDAGERHGRRLEAEADGARVGGVQQ